MHKAVVNLKDRMRRGRRGCPDWKMLCSLSPLKLRAWGGGRVFPGQAQGQLQPAGDLSHGAQPGCSDCWPRRLQPLPPTTCKVTGKVPSSSP